MQWEIILGFIGVIITIIFGFYGIYRNIVKDRIDLEHRLTRIESEINKFNEFYNAMTSIAFSELLKKGEGGKK